MFKTLINKSKESCFQSYLLCFLTVLATNSINQCNGVPSKQLNLQNDSKIIKYNDIKECKKNEYYDFDNFVCVSCKVEDMFLRPTEDKQQCQCETNYSLVYDIIKKRRNCVKFCQISDETGDKSHDSEQSEMCLKTASISTRTVCSFQYINYTLAVQKEYAQRYGQNTVIVSETNPNGNAENCTMCNVQYNYKYKNYCIVNSLLKPYLHYNSYALGTAKVSHFGDLKFVAFFCLSMHNTTACNRLANLCVLSHYSFDKNSPCSSFLLTQASDVVLKYGTFDEQIHANKPYLFYKKGKQITQLLQEPMSDTHFTLDTNSKNSKMHLHGIIYDSNGELKQWDEFKLSDVNLCNMQATGLTNAEQQIKFALRYVISDCNLTLDTIINLATIYGNNNFISIYLKTMKDQIDKSMKLQPLPILIEDLSADNQRYQIEDWQLVKRFLMIAAQTKINYGTDTPIYENVHKLSMYRSIRFVENFQIHYKIHDGNRITRPLLKIRYKEIDLNVNSTLDERFSFKMAITFERINEESRREVMFDVVLPLFVLLAGIVSCLRSLNEKRRRHSSIDFCDLECLMDCFLNLSSNIANVLLLGFLLYIYWLAIEFSAQATIKLTLPLMKSNNEFLNITIYSALLLKIIFLSVHFWRLSHIEIFFIDWERPKGCENTHFNQKSNLETASVCSSVRTYIAENNVSAWRIFFTANEWLRLCAKQRTSTVLHGFLLFISGQVYERSIENQGDLVLELFVISSMYLCIYLAQFICQDYIYNRINGNPLQKFVDLCSLANISVLTLVDASYGYYIHGRSPHGFADTDMTSMIIQLQRESQSMCARRGLLSDSDQQTYIILPPQNLKNCIDRLLAPFQRSCAQNQYQNGISTIDSNLERTAIAYSSINRFFCAFIDHAIKDMDYIIKEKSLPEVIFDCEYDNFLTNNKGTFYIDKSYAFGNLLLYGNNFQIFLTQLILLLSVLMLTRSTAMGVIAICIFDLLIRTMFKHSVRYNLSEKTMIDKRFLI